MVNFAGYFSILCLLIVVQLLVASACNRAVALRPWRLLLSIIALIWWTMPLIKRGYIDSFFYPDDSIIHEGTARDIAYLLENGDWRSAAEYFGFGNEGYRVLLGMLYAATKVPELTTYSIHSCLAFWGLLSVLEVVCRLTNARRVPGWLLALFLLNPSALFWTSFNLKEGAMLWGICMMLRFPLRYERTADGRSEGFLLPGIGALTAGFLRPHIAVAYLAALAIGVAVRQRKLGIALLSVAGMFGSVLILKTIAPAFFEAITADGVGVTLSEQFQELNTIGGSGITYARGAPIPLISGFILVTMRPFPWEVADAMAWAAGGEIWLITSAAVFCWYRMQGRLRLLTSSYLLTMLTAITLISVYFTYIYNMGLMVRQRVMVFPALLSMAAMPCLVYVNQRWRVRDRRSQPASGPIDTTNIPAPLPNTAPVPQPAAAAVNASGVPIYRGPGRSLVGGYRRPVGQPLPTTSRSHLPREGAA